jgi:hypothetical protein
MTAADDAQFIALWEQGLPTPEIARRLGITATTAQSRARRFQQRGLIQPRPQGGGEPQVRTPRFLVPTLYGSLELPTLLLALNTPLHPDCGRARAVVDCLVRQGLAAVTIDAFNQLFGAEVMPLRLARDLVDGVPVITPDVAAQHIPLALWHLLRSDQPTRLRRCPECHTYFFDRTRNASQRYCTGRCTSRATSRGYRARQR